MTDYGDDGIPNDVRVDLTDNDGDLLVAAVDPEADPHPAALVLLRGSDKAVVSFGLDYENIARLHNWSERALNWLEARELEAQNA